LYLCSLSPKSIRNEIYAIKMSQGLPVHEFDLKKKKK
jgi:hypothetical protein